MLEGFYSFDFFILFYFIMIIFILAFCNESLVHILTLMFLLVVYTTQKYTYVHFCIFFCYYFQFTCCSNFTGWALGEKSSCYISELMCMLFTVYKCGEKEMKVIQRDDPTTVKTFFDMFIIFKFELCFFMIIAHKFRTPIQIFASCEIHTIFYCDFTSMFKS